MTPHRRTPPDARPCPRGGGPSRRPTRSDPAAPPPCPSSSGSDQLSFLPRNDGVSAGCLVEAGMAASRAASRFPGISPSPRRGCSHRAAGRARRVRPPDSAEPGGRTRSDDHSGRYAGDEGVGRRDSLPGRGAGEAAGRPRSGVCRPEARRPGVRCPKTHRPRTRRPRARWPRTRCPRDRRRHSSSAVSTTFLASSWTTARFSAPLKDSA